MSIPGTYFVEQFIDWLGEVADRAARQLEVFLIPVLAIELAVGIVAIAFIVFRF